MFGLVKAFIELCNLGFNFFIARSEKTEKSRQAEEQKAWQWLEHHLPALENAARDAYSFILQKSSEQVPVEYSEATYPFVEKLNTFPLDDRNAIKANFQQLRGRDSKRAWAKCKSYVDLWAKCMSQFPGDLPDFPYEIESFNKAYRVFKTVTETK